jgi:PRTRC genetic system protein E
MFAELTQLLRKGDTLALTIAREPDGPTGPVLRVNVMPKLFTLDGDHGADRKALNTPLSVVATPAELDSPEFTATLNRFCSSATTLRHTIDEVEATHKSAAAAKTAAKKPGSAATPSARTPAAKQKTDSGAKETKAEEASEEKAATLGAELI